LAAPISLGDRTGLQLMLDAGADPNQLLPCELLGEEYRDEPALAPVPAAILLGADPALVACSSNAAATPPAPAPAGSRRIGWRPARAALSW
jgi:hypothetical protein